MTGRLARGARAVLDWVSCALLVAVGVDLAILTIVGYCVLAVLATLGPALVALGGVALVAWLALCS